MAEEKEAKEGEGADAAKPKSKKKLIIIIAVVVLLLVGGGGAFAFMGKSKAPADGEHGEEHEEQQEQVHYKLAKLDPFIVNLSENAAFVKVTILVEYDPAVLEKAGGHGEGGGHGGGGGGGGGESDPQAVPPAMKAREPMIRDSIIRVLSSKRAEEVLTVDGKQKLKEELIEAINEAVGLEQGAVVNIYFSEFIIQ